MVNEEWLWIAPFPERIDETLHLVNQNLDLGTIFDQGKRKSPETELFLMEFLLKLGVLVRQVTVLAWQVNAFRTFTFTKEAQKNVVANLYRCFSYLDRGRRYSNDGPNDSEVLLSENIASPNHLIILVQALVILMVPAEQKMGS